MSAEEPAAALSPVWARPSHRANRLLRDAVRAHEAGAAVAFFCECGSNDCNASVPLTCGEYDLWRELHGTITAHGHDEVPASRGADRGVDGGSPPWTLYVPAADGTVIGFRRPAGGGEIVWPRHPGAAT